MDKINTNKGRKKKIENRHRIEAKSNTDRNLFFENINKLNKPLA